MSKILIADDNAQNLYLARFLLEQQGHDIDEAHNGEEAVQAVHAKAYDLVLMDIQMPIMDGLQATTIIKAGSAAPVVVALTAKAMAGDQERILAAGCDGYIAKPISPTGFAEQVQAYLT
jgi:two-component system cell cycle response regulator DivK